MAAYVLTLKWEIHRGMEDKLALYTLLEKIEDEDLYKRGKSAIELCRIELENLSKGILHLKIGKVFRYLANVSNSAKHHIRAVYVGLDKKYMEMWRTAAEQKWFQQNLTLVKRGITVERLFILSRSAAIYNASGKLRVDIKEVLEGQAKGGIKVHIVWQEELEEESLIQDFAIIDDQVAFVTTPEWTSAYSNMSVLKKRV